MSPKEAAQSLIDGLSKLTPQQYENAALLHVQKDLALFIGQAHKYGIKHALSIQTTREDFDLTYAELRAQGVMDPQGLLKQEADFLLALKENPNPIGFEFIAKTKAARILGTPMLAAELGITENSVLSELFQQHAVITPGPGLTQDELDYIAARRLIVDHTIASGNYAIPGEHGPNHSPWAQKIRSEQHAMRLKESVDRYPN